MQTSQRKPASKADRIYMVLVFTASAILVAVGGWHGLAWLADKVLP